MSKFDNLADHEIDTDDLESVSGGFFCVQRYCHTPCPKPVQRCEEKKRCWEPPCKKKSC